MEERLNAPSKSSQTLNQIIAGMEGEYRVSRDTAYADNNKPQQSYWEGALRALGDVTQRTSNLHAPPDVARADTLNQELESTLKQIRDVRDALEPNSVLRRLVNKACDRLDVAISKIRQSNEIPSQTLNDCRAAFESWCEPKALDMTVYTDPWTEKCWYQHSHINAMWNGWKAAWNQRPSEISEKEGRTFGILQGYNESNIPLCDRQSKTEHSEISANAHVEYDAFLQWYAKDSQATISDAYEAWKAAIAWASTPKREIGEEDHLAHGNPNYYQQAKELALENHQLKALVKEQQKDLDIRLDIEKELLKKPKSEEAKKAKTFLDVIRMKLERRFQVGDYLRDGFDQDPPARAVATDICQDVMAHVREIHALAVKGINEIEGGS